jgi:hypothetical protein
VLGSIVVLLVVMSAMYAVGSALITPTNQIDASHA